MVGRFQRKDALSNAHAGREFEEAAELFFHETGIQLQRNFIVDVGYHKKKPHKFDLGSDDPPVLVEQIVPVDRNGKKPECENSRYE